MAAPVPGRQPHPANRAPEGMPCEMGEASPGSSFFPGPLG